MPRDRARAVSRIVEPIRAYAASRIEREADRTGRRLAVFSTLPGSGLREVARGWSENARPFYFRAGRTGGDHNRGDLEQLLARRAGAGPRPNGCGRRSWESLFRTLLRVVDPRPSVVAIDRFDRIDPDPGARRAIGRALTRALDTRPDEGPPVLVSGTSVRRRTFPDHRVRRLPPLDHRRATEHLGVDSSRDRLIAYATFGGLAGTLASYDPNRSVEENIQRGLLDPASRTRRRLETALRAYGSIRSEARYRTVLRGIGAVARRFGSIAHRACGPSRSELSRKLHRLIGYGIVRRHRDYASGRSATHRYRITDPAWRFHYGFVARRRMELVLRHPEEVWASRNRPAWHRYLRSVLAEALRRAVRAGEVALEAPPTRRTAETHRASETRRPSEYVTDPPVGNTDLDRRCVVSAWKGPGVSGRQTRIDLIVAERASDRVTWTGQVFWRDEPIDRRRLHRLDILTRILAESDISWARSARERSTGYVLASAGGFTDRLRRIAERGYLGRPVRLVDPDALFERPPRLPA